MFKTLNHQIRIRHVRNLRVLQLDGGGFLGYVFFDALEVLETNCGHGRLCEAFDLIYGTSTGAIIGAALAAGASVAEIRELYTQHGDYIFKPVNSWWLPWRRINRPLYDRNCVIDSLTRILEKYGVTKMRDLKTRFVAVTVNECEKVNVFLKSWYAEFADLDVTEAVARSFAALMYFGHVIDKKALTCYSDGATGTLNCALMFSYFEAQDIAITNSRAVSSDDNAAMLGSNDPHVTDIDIYSFGCGTIPQPVPFSKVSKWGNIRQLWNTFLAKGQLLARIQSVQDQVRALNWIRVPQMTNPNYKGTRVHLMRIDSALPDKLNVIDKPKYIKEYAAIGAATAMKRAESLKFYDNN